MNQRRHVTLVAGAATLLTAMPMSTIFDAWTWLIDCILAVGAIVAVAVLARTLRAPLLAQIGAMAATLLIMVTWLFPSGHEFLGLVPTTSTFRHFGELFSAAAQDMRDEGVPVPDRPGLLFLTVLGIGLVAITVDLAAVGLRRPALAGLPMLAIYSVPVAVHQDSVSFIPFAIGSLGFLWLLVTDNVDRVRRFGRRFTGDGRDVDLWEPSPLAAAGRRLGIIGVLAAILLPAAIPGMTGGLLDRFGTNGTGAGLGSGRGGTAVNLFADFAGQLTQDKIVSMVKVSTNEPDPYYLRLATADELSGNGFHTRPPTSGRRVTGSLGAAPRANNETTYHASVDILTLQMSYLPIYSRLTRVQRLDGSWLYDSGNNVLYSTRSKSRGLKYSFDYVRAKYTTAELKAAPALASDDPLVRRDAGLPQEVPQVQTKVAELIKGKSTPYDKVRAIYDYFSPSNGFSYAASTKSGTSGNDIADFLEKKQGFCEQYAATLAWMVRAAGIPARVALGFARGSQKAGSTYTLTNRNLHAWTEVYFQGFGWVPFDATPATAVAGSVSSSWAPGVASAGGGTNDNGEDPRVGQANPGATAGAPAEHGPNLSAPTAPTPLPQSDPWPWISIAAAAVILVLLFSPALYRVAVRRRRTPQRSGAASKDRTAVEDAAHATDHAPDTPRPAGPAMVVTSAMSVTSTRQDAHDVWDELRDTLVDYRFALNDAETPRAMIERIIVEIHALEPTALAARLLGRAEERARYAPAPLASGDLVSSLRTVRGAIKHRASLRTRLRATLLPPSVTARWSFAVVSAFSGFTAMAGRSRDVLVHATSPRRLFRPRRALAGGPRT